MSARPSAQAARSGDDGSLTALVFANGKRPSKTLARRIAAGVNLVVAADGGADAALAVGIVPDVVIGDLDSVSAAAREELGPARVIPNRDPNRTDLQKALDLCVERGVSEVRILGAGGGRADHALANLSLLLLYRGKLGVTISDEQFDIRAVATKERLRGRLGTVVSLVALSNCTGVTTTGLRWDLTDASLAFSPRGIHNELAAPEATVSLNAGDLLVFHGRWVEKHG